MSNNLYKRYFQLRIRVKTGEPIDPKHITDLENSIQLRIYDLNELKEQVQVLKNLNELNHNLKDPDNEDSAEPKIKCCLCNKPILEKESNDPWPIKHEGRCCHECNINRVVKARRIAQGSFKTK